MEICLAYHYASPADKGVIIVFPSVAVIRLNVFFQCGGYPC